MALTACIQKGRGERIEDQEWAERKYWPSYFLARHGMFRKFFCNLLINDPCDRKQVFQQAVSALSTVYSDLAGLEHLSRSPVAAFSLGKPASSGGTGRHLLVAVGQMTERGRKSRRQQTTRKTGPLMINSGGASGNETLSDSILPSEISNAQQRGPRT